MRYESHQAFPQPPQKPLLAFTGLSISLVGHSPIMYLVIFQLLPIISHQKQTIENPATQFSKITLANIEFKVLFPKLLSLEPHSVNWLL